MYKWNVDGKIMCIVLDNCSTNDAVFKVLKEKFHTKLVSDVDVFHVKCSAHIVDLVVQKIIESINYVIVKFRENVKYIKLSIFKWKQFKELASQV